MSKRTSLLSLLFVSRCEVTETRKQKTFFLVFFLFGGGNSIYLFFHFLFQVLEFLFNLIIFLVQTTASSNECDIFPAEMVIRRLIRHHFEAPIDSMSD